MSFMTEEKLQEAMKLLWTSYGENYENILKTLQENNLVFSDEETKEFLDFYKASPKHSQEDMKEMINAAIIVATSADNEKMYNRMMARAMHGNAGNMFIQWFEHQGIDYLAMEESVNMPDIDVDSAKRVASSLSKKGIDAETIYSGEDKAYLVIKESDYAETIAAIAKEDRRELSDDELAHIDQALSMEYIEEVIEQIQPVDATKEAMLIAERERAAVREYYAQQLDYIKNYAYNSKNMVVTHDVNDRMFDAIIEGTVSDIRNFEQLQIAINDLRETYELMTEDHSEWTPEIKKEAEKALRAAEKFSFERRRTMSKVGKLLATVTKASQKLELLEDAILEEKSADLGKETVEALKEEAPEVSKELNETAENTAKESINIVRAGLASIQDDVAEIQKAYNFLGYGMWTKLAELPSELAKIGERVRNATLEKANEIADKAAINFRALSREVQSIGHIASQTFRAMTNLQDGLAVELKQLARAYRLTAERFINVKTMGAHERRAQRILNSKFYNFEGAMKYEMDAKAEKAQKEAGEEVEIHDESIKDSLSYMLLKPYAWAHGLKDLSELQAYLTVESQLKRDANLPKTQYEDIKANREALIAHAKEYIQLAKTRIVEMQPSLTDQDGYPKALEDLKADVVRFKARERIALFITNISASLAAQESKRALNIILDKNTAEAMKAEKSIATIEDALEEKNYSAKENAALNVAMGIDESKAEAEHWRRYTEESLVAQKAALSIKQETLFKLNEAAEEKAETKELLASELKEISKEIEDSSANSILKNLESIENTQKAAGALVFAYSQNKEEIEAAITEIEANLKQASKENNEFVQETAKETVSDVEYTSGVKEFEKAAKEIDDLEFIDLEESVSDRKDGAVFGIDALYEREDGSPTDPKEIEAILNDEKIMDVPVLDLHWKGFEETIEQANEDMGEKTAEPRAYEEKEGEIMAQIRTNSEAILSMASNEPSFENFKEVLPNFTNSEIAYALHSVPANSETASKIAKALQSSDFDARFASIVSKMNEFESDEIAPGVIMDDAGKLVVEGTDEKGFESKEIEPKDFDNQTEKENTEPNNDIQAEEEQEMGE